MRFALLLSMLAAMAGASPAMAAPAPHAQKKGQTKSSSRVEQIKRQIRRVQNSETASEAAEKLVAFGPEAIPYVIEALGKPREGGEVNLDLAFCLGDFGTPMKRPMLNALANGNMLQKRGVMIGIVYMAECMSLRAPREKSPALEEAVATNREENARRFRFLHEEDVRRGLRKALSSTNHEVAGSAAKVLGYLGAKEAMLELIVMTESPVDQRALEAFEGLVSLLDMGDFPVLRKAYDMVLAKSGDAETAENRIDALTETLTYARTEVGQALLHHLLKHRIGRIRLYTMIAYITRREEGVLDLLVPLLEDEDIAIRRGALAAVGNQKGGERYYDRMLASLRSSNAHDRAWGAFSLGLTRKAEALPILLDLVADKEDVIREYVAKGLGKFEDPRAMAALKKLAKDPVQNVRDSAVEAMDPDNRYPDEMAYFASR